MMRKKRNNKALFKFRKFSQKQKKLMTWWMDYSPHSSKDIVIADGSIRSGKTVSMANGFVDWSLAEFEHENFILAGKSMGALTKNVLNPLKKMLNAKGLEYYHVRSTEEPRLEIGTNNYYLYGANNISSKDTLTGLTAAGSFADQVELFPENFVDTMIDRCSVEGSRHWWNCNPQGPYHYMKKEFIDLADEKHIYHIKFYLDDNLTLSERIKERYRRLHSGVWYERNILGKWVLAEGLIYDMYNADNKVSSLPKMQQHWIGIDYGTANETVFVLMGLGEDDKLYVIDEWRWGEKKQGTAKTDLELRKALQKFIEKNDVMPKWILVDPSAKSFLTEVYGHKEQFPIFSKVRGANNTVLDGIRNVSSLLGANQLLVQEGLENLEEEFYSYSWDEKAEQKGEDKPIKKHDHGLDAIRYVINTIPRVVDMVLRKAA